MRQDHARDRRARRQAAGAGRDAGEPLALAQFMESRDGKLVFCMDRKAVRRAARQGAVVAALYKVLRDRSRNILFNSLGLGEDEVPMTLRPDCTDMVYFLRAYFAFKMGLPFGYSVCSRGGGGKPP